MPERNPGFCAGTRPTRTAKHSGRDAVRRKELCEALLAVNRESGERTKLRDETGNLVKEWKAQAEQIAGLERLGFTITKGKKHYKMRWQDSGYFKTLSASPSDVRTGANGLAEMLATFF